MIKSCLIMSWLFADHQQMIDLLWWQKHFDVKYKTTFRIHIASQIQIDWTIYSCWCLFYYSSVIDVIYSAWQKFLCRAFFNGRVDWHVAGSFESSCDLNMYKFPFDTQTCSLEFGSLVHVISVLRLTAMVDFVEFTFYVPNKEFRYCDMHICWSIYWNINTLRPR